MKNRYGLSLCRPDLAIKFKSILAAVGQLQFDVVARLRAEYGVETSVDMLPFTCAHWIEYDPKQRNPIYWPTASRLAYDRIGRLVAMFPSEWELKYCMEKNPGVVFKELG